MKDYRVTIELEVTADSQEEAIENAVMDIKELHQNGTLEPNVKEI